ncbi:MAG: 7TM diverse intracellular signaling domain-containing protein [Campylobacterota bacterium]|nr:7TM diverse intracellular signaling domain-containing protein [Campylobacterota bacterium]
MSIHILKKLILFFIFYLTIQSPANAISIDTSSPEKISLLQHSAVYIDKENLPSKVIMNEKSFVPYHQVYINKGVTSETIWITFTLKNDSAQNIDKLLVLSSPLVGYIALYDKTFNTPPIVKGAAHIAGKHATLFPYFKLSLPPHTSKTYILEVKSKINPIDFGLWLQNEKEYLQEDQMQQFIDILLVGIVLALMLYSFILAIYTKDKSYLYYSFYLFALIYQQLTYLGLTQIYFPLSFVTLDIRITVFKITLLVITAALFSMHFLKSKNMPAIHKGYRVFIFISLAEMFILSIPKFYNLHIVILTGALFIIFNLSAGIFSYNKGNTQARLFIIGFGIVFISYLFIILNAIGVTSIMQDFQNILMFSTAFEALILSLAFADRYTLLQKEKEKVDRQIISESKHRTKMIEKEVEIKTLALNDALESKELLLQEVHHRVKNNLQIILSIIRLQNDEIENQHMTEKFNNLENRINAISKTYNMLLIKDNHEEVEMQEYIDSLLLDIQETINHDTVNIEIKTEIDATIPLRESVYIGLIINELLTNTYKYAFDDHRGTVFISLQHQNNHYTLCVQDDGKGFTPEEFTNSLGLQLIHTLVYDQLGGEMETSTNSHTQYTIRFTL